VGTADKDGSVIGPTYAAAVASQRAFARQSCLALRPFCVGKFTAGRFRKLITPRST
jgi:hypothetical protein